MARIMVVDDVASMCQLIKAALESAGHRVIAARDGDEAQVLALTKKVHLVVTDVNMPRINGLELIRILRTMTSYSHTPILVLTNDAKDENIEKARALGACGWVVKPFTPEQLIATVNQVLVDKYVNN